MTAKPSAGVDYNRSRLDVAVVSPHGRSFVSYACYDLGRDVASQVRAVARCAKDLFDAGVGIVVMEKPWMREGRGLGEAMKLHRVPTRVETLCVYVGLDVRFVPINSWHSQILGNGALRSKDGKAASLKYVSMVYGWQAPSADASDAVCLATWGATQLAMEEVA